jgi:recombination protein RecT
MSDLRKFNADLTNEKTQKYLTEILGNRKASFVNNIVALVSNNVKLQECEPITLMFAALKATALNLPLDQNLGYAYIIPYKDNKAKTTLAQFQIGKNGFVQLALRSSQFKTINVSDVREGELKSMDRLSGECVFEWKEDRISLPVIGYVAYMKLLSGFEKPLYMTVKEIEVHGKKFSKTYTYGPWKDDFNSMAEKTVIKRLLSKYAPLSVEMQQAIMADQAVITREGEVYVDNELPEHKEMPSGDEKKKLLKEKKTEVKGNTDGTLPLSSAPEMK